MAPRKWQWRPWNQAPCPLSLSWRKLRSWRNWDMTSLCSYMLLSLKSLFTLSQNIWAKVIKKGEKSPCSIIFNYNDKICLMDLKASIQLGGYVSYFSGHYDALEKKSRQWGKKKCYTTQINWWLIFHNSKITLTVILAARQIIALYECTRSNTFISTVRICTVSYNADIPFVFT